MASRRLRGGNSASAVEQYLSAYPFEVPRFRCRAGDSAGEIDRAAVPVASAVDGVTKRESTRRVQDGQQ